MNNLRDTHGWGNSQKAKPTRDANGARQTATSETQKSRHLDEASTSHAGKQKVEETVLRAVKCKEQPKLITTQLLQPVAARLLDLRFAHVARPSRRPGLAISLTSWPQDRRKRAVRRFMASLMSTWSARLCRD